VEQQGTDDLFNITLLIQRMATFSLAFPDLLMLPRSKRATSCCHLLSVRATIKRDPIKSCFPKNTNLVITRHTNRKVCWAHFWCLSQVGHELKKRDKDGPKGNSFSVVLPKTSSLSFQTAMDPGVLKTARIITRPLFLSRKRVSCPLGDDG